MVQLIAVGASAGGVNALTRMADRLPADLAAPVLVVLHVPADAPTRLPEILARRTALDVAHASDGERIRAGTIRIAPPDHHLVVRDGQIHLGRTPRENRHRPSIDVLFSTAAEWYGDGLAAVVLSGGPGDGPAGLRFVQDMGGKVLVQDPDDAMVAALPASAIELITPDLVGSPEQLGSWLVELANERRTSIALRKEKVRDQMRDQVRNDPTMEAEGWRPSAFACPDCTGVLWERDDGRLVRFRCRIGHSFGPDALVDGKGDELESALWSAINTMEERGELATRLAGRAQERGYGDSSLRFARTADDMRRHAAQIRELVGSWDDDRLEGVASTSGATEPMEVETT
jgi:two-component system chemotaxis response regulator CheB